MQTSLLGLHSETVINLCVRLTVFVFKTTGYDNEMRCHLRF